MSLLAEIKRRKVFRVAAAYAVVAWLLIQVAALVFPILALPVWTVPFVTVALILGFPVALLLAWAYELTPDGIRRTRSKHVVGAENTTGRAAGYTFTAVVAASVGGALVWYLSRDADLRWLMDEAIPEIEAHIDTGKWEAAFAAAVAAESRVPDAPVIEELWPRFSHRLTIPSEPSGATVYRRPYNAPDSDWIELGRTPLEDIRLPLGLHVLRFELEGYVPLYRTIGSGMVLLSDLTELDSSLRRLNFWIGTETFELGTESSLPEGKVRVPGWTDRIAGETVAFQDFYLDRYEVTNAQYKAFVDADGYERASLWDPIIRNGQEIPWQEAMALFTDRTGRPGPSTWTAGDFDEGQEDYPVTGVSWYEASAYARFMGQELPTVYHWERAVAPAAYAWLLPASNLTDDSPRPVTESRAMSYSGSFDLLGNVREWLATAQGDHYAIRGGSWIDPYYVALGATTALPLDRSPYNGFRLAIMRDEASIRALARTPLEPPASGRERQPVSDATYMAYSGFFEYERGPLNATTETTETTRVWTRERIELDTEFSNDRMVMYLFIPTDATPPYQTVIYWPGSAALASTSIDEYANHLDFVVKSGRAVAFPVYKGTFERGGGEPVPASGTIADRDGAAQRIKELRRTIDYLETRPDIDRGAIGFYGHSWGARRGVSAIAQDGRIRAAILYVCCSLQTPRPEVDPVNALPRVTIPTLMLNGEFDSIVPVEEARYLFNLLGSPENDKQLIVDSGTHFVRRDRVIRETLDWLDRHLGPVRN